ncbi:MAG: hypothetical protein IKF83_03050 [Clostridia bacterium]|nr:hypothetical protein [Clostridia bacterium]
MKKVNFIGAYDKTDCIIYIAKILQTVGKKVLVVDSTTNQKAKYVVPAIKPTVSYITEFEEIDVAVGFYNLDDIKKYLSISEEKEMEYDYILIDIDKGEAIDAFDVRPEEDNYFVTGFDLYSLKKGLEALNNLSEPLNLTKVLFSKGMFKEEDDYLNFLSAGYKIIWKENRIYFPIENGDASALAENQRTEKIKFKTISQQYRESLIFIAEEILKDTSDSKIRKAIRIFEKEKGV